ncbi:helix-turn-helix domain-containing protein [Leptospira sp. WS92.C1]
MAFLLSIANFLNNQTEIHSKNPKKIAHTKAERTDEFPWFQSLYRKAAAILFLMIGVVQFHVYLELSGELKNVSWFAEIHIPAIFLIGPLIYLYFESLSGAKPTRFRLFHLLPSLFSWIILLPFYLQGSDQKQNFIENKNPDDPFHLIVLLMLICGTVSNFLYPASLFRNVWKWRKQTNSDRRISFSPFLALFAGTLFVLFLFVIAQIFFLSLFPIAASGLTILICAVFLIGATNSGIIENFRQESREARYKESRVMGLDVDAVIIRLDELMKTKRLYLDENLTLSGLSKILNIQTHQLSEILNNRLHRSFRDYVTQFRLDEAIKLLREEPERSVLSIVYASGFNSKSAFHKLFQERFGCSPSMFRSENR